MNRIIRFSNATALAIHSMIAMAKSGKTRLSARTIAKEYNASENHLKKVLQRLAAAGLVVGQTGPSGGFTITTSPSKVTLIQIFEAIEGPYKPSYCLFDPPLCKKGDCLIFGPMLNKLNSELESYLKKTNLSKIINIQHN